MVTNASISIYSKGKSWDQSQSPTLVGVYDVFINEEEQHLYKNVGGTPTLVGVGKGVVFIWDEVSLDDCYFTYNGERFEIVKIETWRLSGGTFGHIEVVYQ